jgi:uncharacterized protein (TIGR02145 family)
MKKIKLSLTIVSLILFFGCSTSTDSNGNSTTTVVPLPPTNLIGNVFSSTQINLSWTDHSTNETSFKIERKTGTGTFAIVGTTASDITIFSDAGLTPGTTYVYRVYSNNAVGNSLSYSNELTLTTNIQIGLPILSTIMPSFITSDFAFGGGNIESDGGAPIIEKGIVWSTNQNPTINLSTKATNGTVSNTFNAEMTNLNSNTIYFVRAFATNSVGTAYGNEFSFTTLSTTVTDIDGNAYSLVTICSQVWTKTNLNVTHYRNGDVIPQVTDATQWATLTTGAWCYYNNDSANGAIYGKLYNWYAVHDTRGLAPVGFHIPTDSEWTTLTTCLGGEIVAGGKMKETGTNHWISPNTNATNSSGFACLPGGYRSNFTMLPNSKGYQAWFWSSSEYDNTNAWFRYIINNNESVNRNSYDYSKIFGFSVRCIKD